MSRMSHLFLELGHRDYPLFLPAWVSGTSERTYLEAENLVERSGWKVRVVRYRRPKLLLVLLYLSYGQWYTRNLRTLWSFVSYRTALKVAIAVENRIETLKA